MDQSDSVVEPESGADSGSGSEASDTDVELALAELRTTFEYQVQRLREIDSKAIEILKANLLLIGIVVTAGSILVQTDLDIGLFLNLFTVTGLILLLASTALAGVTYTVSNLRGGIASDGIEAAIASRDRESETEFQDRLLRSYARWIEYNARVTAVNDMFATVTVLLVIDSFVFVIAGLLVGVLAPGLVISALAFLGLTVLLTVLSRLAYHMDHLGPTDPRWEGTFEGIRVSKGATREDGWRALLEMLGKSPEYGESQPDADSGRR